MSKLVIKDISKDFKETKVLKHLDINIPDGSFTVLLGPSGCGKSTLLRIIAGLETPTTGEIYVGDRNITTEEPKDRDVAMVFQNYALYPHMNVTENVEYGLKIKKVPKEERKEMVKNALEMVELSDQANKLPAQMSGGQRQRVALARAVVKNPKVFLMDEPLSNLDAKLRNQMREKITMLHKKLGTTFVYVTHDQVEAMSMGTNIILLNGGSIMQEGTPKEIYTNPQNVFVAGFIGSPPTNIIKFKKGYIGIRPEKVLLNEKENEGDIIIKGEVLSEEQLGDGTIFNIKTSFGNIKAKRECVWETLGDEVNIVFPEKDIMLFNKDGDRIPFKKDIYLSLMGEVL